MSKAVEFLMENLKKENKLLGLENNHSHMEYLINEMMNDERDMHRYKKISQYLKPNIKILDMAAGCGNFVFLGLKKGYDVYGIEPEIWKHEFIKLKAKEYGYPSKWLNKFTIGIGEKLPYQDNSFDIVSTYQTLEHVQDIQKCLSEILRVTKKGGIIHIECPDYRGTFEPHYNVSFLPLFPKKIAKIYLKLIGKNPSYLDTINYTTTPLLIKILKNLANKNNINIEIINMHKINHLKSGKKYSYIISQFFIFFQRLFKKNLTINLIILIKNK